VHPRHRDGLLAAVGLAVLATVVVTTRGVAALFEPRAIVTGAVCAVALELPFLRDPDRALAVWERRGVPAVALVALLAAAVPAVRVAPWLLGAAVWGLLVYLGLLARVLAGLGNPLARVLGR
jgi:hypothetical protein